MSNKNQPKSTPNKKKRNRRILGSRSYRNYSIEMVELATEMIKKKLISSRQAEKQFGIPRRTLLNKVKKMHIKPAGGQKRLTDEEEDNIVKVLIATADYGCPMTKLDLKMLVFKYLQKNSRTDVFKGKMPGNAWVENFLQRHSSKLTVRTTQNITQVRAQKGLKEMESFFENLQETLKDIPPSHILNYDETNLADNPGASKCIFRRGIKYPERIVNSTKSCISIMFTVCASGYCLPTYVVYKATNLYTEWVEGGPDQTRYNCTKSGWFDSSCFEDYFQTIVIEWAKKVGPGPKVVIGDNLSSHLNVEVINMCEKHNVRLVFLPPNSTHLTQPLDVAYFAPLKKEWRKILLEYKIRHPGQTTLNKKHFPKLLYELTEKIQFKDSKNIKSGFKAAGIFPVNARNIFKRIPEYFDDADYGIDSVVIDYLKEMRAPKPMQVKRCKKLLTEPGKSVCSGDILTKTDKKVQKKTARKKKINISDILNKRNDESRESQSDSDILDETTGRMIKSSKKIKLTYENVYDEFEIEQNDSDQEDKINKMQEKRGNATIRKLNTVQSLNILCIQTINTKIDVSMQEFTRTSPSLNICTFDKLSKNDNQNVSFIAINENNLPLCLQPDILQTSQSIHKLNILAKDSNQPIITSNVKVTPGVRVTSNKEVYKIKEKLKGGQVIRQSALQLELVPKHNQKGVKRYSNLSPSSSNQLNTKWKRKDLNTKIKTNRKKQSKAKSKASNEVGKKKIKTYNESSSELSDILSIHDTDDSDYETYDAYLLSLKEQDDKENIEPELDTVPFGCSEIQYYTEDYKKDDWIVAKFSTKKSLKHYVGRILSVKDNVPTVKFVRRVNKVNIGERLMFTYPNVEDVCDMNHLNDIILVLPQPNISRRGQMMFDVDLSSYNIQ